MRILTVNAGSTSLKRHLVEDGRAEAVDDFVRADAVGHRIVHGGELREPAVIDEGVEQAIRWAVEVAPLHNAPALDALDAARSALPSVPHVAVFDTGFHSTLDPAMAVYAVPPEWGVRRLGFQGISVEWAASQVPAARLVVCHLGGGSSVTAVRDGLSVDTTMGYTPLDGVPMAKRPGALDPGVLIHVLRSGGLTLDELDDALNHRSGLLALGGSARVEELEVSGEPRARLALDVFSHRIAGAVAASAVSLGGLDAVVFTGGVGEHSARVRSDVCERLRFLGVEIDAGRNEEGDGDLQAESSRVRIAVVESREELVIAGAVEGALSA